MSEHRLPPEKSPPSEWVLVWRREAVLFEAAPLAFDDERIRKLRSIAGQLGWAIGVHGSRIRDIDLIAAPWTDDACDVLELLDAFMHRLGLAITHFERKPHGRLGVVLHGVGTKPIDLSVMPLRGE